MIEYNWNKRIYACRLLPGKNTEIQRCSKAGNYPVSDEV
jgi:hypothetical protein